MGFRVLALNLSEGLSDPGARKHLSDTTPMNL